MGNKADLTEKTGMNDKKFPETRQCVSGRILLAEDNIINREVALEMLAGSGMQIDVADNGAQAVEAASRIRYDAILMDIQMPVMDGIEAARRIREQEAGGNPVPIIAMTAGTLAKDRQNCLDAGMNDFISKPLYPDVLVSQIGKWLPPVAAHSRNYEQNAAPSPPAYPGIDLDSAMKRLVGNRDLLERLMGEFYLNYKDGGPVLLSEQGRAAIKNGNLKPALEWLHTLKGVTGNLSAMELNSACVELERRILKGATDSLDPMLSRLEAALKQMLQTAEACYRKLHNRPKQASLTSQPDKDPAMDRLLDHMASHLEKNSLKAEDLLVLIRDRLGNWAETVPEVSKTLQILSEQVEDFAFRDARKTLDRLTNLLHP